ncbi:MbtH family protein [Streptomyces sioyaensis]|uniref:MbtH family protein n=1 Tax=Streptomyces sioyaensis TaxID=67364 RepID=UPI00379977C5
MHPEDSDDLREYSVVRNGEGQYSIWFADREVPIGWFEVGRRGRKADCLAYIEDEWSDMRPSSVRDFHAAR